MTARDSAQGAAVLLLPSALADVAGGARRLPVPGGEATTLEDVLDAVRKQNPLLERRIRDEAGALRRYVNVYVDGDDVRGLGGLATPVPDGAEVHVLPSVAGG